MTPRHVLSPVLCALLAGAFAAGASADGVAAPPDPQPPQRVEIAAALPSHEEHAYADLLDAMTRFEAWHATHPGTRLDFRVQARKQATVMEGLALTIDDPVTRQRVPVDLAPDGRFTLPVSATLREHAAIVRANRTDGSLAWMLRVTHDGDDPHERRLGDLREECRLDLYAATLARGIKTPSFYALKAAGDVCASRLVGWVAYADRPVFAAHVREGGRDVALPGDSVHGGEMSTVPMAPLMDWPYLLRDRVYFVHRLMADAGWSDAAVVRLNFADDPADVPQAAARAVAP